ncbi:nuclear transport factor 2 family protein [Nocardioides daejeonensis]|uniref:nuclear transport factor 2 family protein n=1 Tax=Nocardioides daejeonensis TaxID=1046556 RepID=UPI000D743EEA|nr:nuclear transport factor 2 family protein [Nocardioides daejeonensis]
MSLPGSANATESEAAEASVTTEAKAALDLDAGGLPARQWLAGGLLTTLLIGAAACGAFALRDDVAPATAEAKQAALRDEASAATVRDMEVLLSADHHAAAETFQRWSEVTTGRLHTQLTKGRASIRRQIQAAKEVTSVRTLESALVSWDESAGTARVLTVVELTTTKAKTGPTKRTARYLAMAQRVDDAWRLSAIRQVGGE